MKKVKESVRQISNKRTVKRRKQKKVDGKKPGPRQRGGLWASNWQGEK